MFKKFGVIGGACLKHASNGEKQSIGQQQVRQLQIGGPQQCKATPFVHQIL